MTAAAEADKTGNGPVPAEPGKAKLHGRAFYESIGSPKYVVAPMVDQSEFAWRMLTRSFMPASEQSKLLAYTPMLHARLFQQEEKYRKAHFQAVRPQPSSSSPEAKPEPWLDGNPNLDRPLFVQFCANDPDQLLGAARHAAPYCDAVDLNLGCPQGIARKGKYGAFLQEDQDLIFRLINTLHRELDVPVTAKIRILETREATLEYARMVLRAGASVLTVHGRRREQKGHHTGVADWEMLRFLRENLPPETVLFANGNVLQPGDVERCLEATGADGVMSAEGNLSDPAIFGEPPPVGEEGREYWRGKNGIGGWRVDAIMRRYLDLLHKYVDGVEPPERRPLFMPGDDTAWMNQEEDQDGANGEEPPRKKRKHTADAVVPGSKKPIREVSPNMSAVQPHLFHLLRHLVSRHTDVRDMLARSPKQGLAGFERVLAATEHKVASGLLEYERTGGASYDEEVRELFEQQEDDGAEGEESSVPTRRRCRRPWWVAQPIIRPLPSEAAKKGAIRPSKKEMKEKAAAAAAAGEAKEGTAVVGKEEVKKVVEEEKQKDIASRDELVAG